MGKQENIEKEREKQTNKRY